MDRMQQQNIASKLTLEEKCYLISDKDFWQNCSMRTKGSLNMNCQAASTASASRRTRVVGHERLLEN